tara:strand:+ start:17813 stop:18103 length:291 start_codon:yes stop_codon:yes gene_type:complete
METFERAADREWEAKLSQVMQGIHQMLVSKRQAYGASIDRPVGIFLQASSDEIGLRARIDDKLSRIARGDGTGDEDAIDDLIGYLIMLQIKRQEQR